MCEDSKSPPTKIQLEHAIRRNFGGMESDSWNPFDEFKEIVEMGLDHQLEVLVAYLVTSVMLLFFS